MKRKLACIFLLSFAGFACNRVTMEESPEALVSYGLPSQHSNSVPDVVQKNQPNTELGWLDSSAIHPKPRAD